MEPMRLCCVFGPCAYGSFTGFGFYAALTGASEAYFIEDATDNFALKTDAQAQAEVAKDSSQSKYV